MECAFDAGDCGLKNFDQLFKVQLTSMNDSTYYIEPGFAAFYISFTNVSWFCFLLVLYLRLFLGI